MDDGQTQQPPQRALERLRVAEQTTALLRAGELPQLEAFIFQARFALRQASSIDDLEAICRAADLDDISRHSLPGACIALSSREGVRAAVTYRPDATATELAFFAQALRGVLIPTYAALGLDMSAAISFGCQDEK